VWRSWLALFVEMAQPQPQGEKKNDADGGRSAMRVTIPIVETPA